MGKDIEGKGKKEFNWSLVEDSSYLIGLENGNSINTIIHHPLLNVILAVTNNSKLYVLELSSNNILKIISFNTIGIKLEYIPSMERLAMSNLGVFSLRKHYNGLLLLDNVFQQQINYADDPVLLEVPLTDAIQLLDSMSGSFEEDSVSKEFLPYLQTLVQDAQAESQKNKNKWVSVIVKGKHSYLHKTLSHLLNLLKQIGLSHAGLPILSSLLDQLTLLQPANSLHQIKEPIEKAVMHNECARLDTFKNWPHVNHKWALPKPMCQAGFYFHPTNPSIVHGDDRAMCFACNVSLIYWEANDEPWSEHERHSPSCPFAKGQYTTNVPINATQATEPAQSHCHLSQLSAISTTSSDRYIATISHNNQVIIWDSYSFLRKSLVFNIDLEDPFLKISLFPHQKKKSIKISKNDFHSQALCFLSLTTPIVEKNHLITTTLSSKQYLIVGVSLRQRKSPKKQKDTGDPKGPQTGQSTVESTEDNVQVLNRRNEQMTEVFKKQEEVEVVKSAGQTKNTFLLNNRTEHNTDEDKESSEDDAASKHVIVKESGSLKSGENSSELASSTNSSVDNHNDALKETTGGNLCTSGGSGQKGTEFSCHEAPLSESREKTYLCLLVYDVTKVKKSTKCEIKNKSMSSVLDSYNKTPFNLPPINQSNNNNPANDSYEFTDFFSDSLKSALVDFLDSDEDSSENLTDVNMAKVDTLKEEDDDVKIIGVEYPPIVQLHNQEYCEPQHLSTSQTIATPFPNNAAVQEEYKGALKEFPSIFCEEIFEGVGSGDNYNNNNLLHNNLLFNDDKKSSASEPFNDNSSSTKNHFHTFKSVCNELQNQDLGKNKLQNNQENALVEIIKLPAEVQDTLNQPIITHIFHTDDNFLIVVVSSKKANKNKGDKEVRSWILTYLINPHQSVVLSDKPLTLKPYKEVFTSVSLLPSQLMHQAIFNEDDDVRDEELLLKQLMQQQDKLNSDNKNNEQESSKLNAQLERMCQTTTGALMLLTSEGSVLLASCRDYSVLACLNPPPDQAYTAATFCAGIDKICLTTRNNDIKYFSLNPALSSSSSSSVSLEGISAEDGLAKKKHHKKQQLEELSLLTRQPLSFNVLVLLHRLTVSEGIFLKYAHAKPFCWKELPQFDSINAYTDTSITTKTWKLPSDLNITNEDNSFELLFPEACSVDHVFVRLLYRTATCPSLVPPLRISLLKPSSMDHKQGNNTYNEINTSEELYTTYLENKYKAKMVCGPRQIQPFTELTELQAGVHLSSPLLLKDRCKSLIVHFKGEKGKLSLIKEVSICVRKFKKISIPLEGLTRHRMLEDTSFHERLLQLMSGMNDDSLGQTSTKTQSLVMRDMKLHLCFDLFMWVFNTNKDTSSFKKHKILLELVQKYIGGLLNNCYMCSDRSFAHHCTRLLCACVSLSSNTTSFETCLLDHMLQHLPLTLSCTSSGSLYYFFILLQQLTSTNPTLVAQTTYQLLKKVTQVFTQRTNYQQDYLRTRLGLYGTPLEPCIYEINPILLNSTMLFLASSSYPSTLTPSKASYLTYSMVVGGSQPTPPPTKTPTATIQSSMFPNKFIFDDIMTLLEHGKHSCKEALLCGKGGCSCGGSGGLLASKEEYVSRFLGGLVEVEPLHFSVSDLSEGCKVEKMDAGGSQNVSSGIQQSQDTQVLDSFSYPSPPISDLQLPPPSSSSLENPMGNFLHCKEFMLMKLHMQKKKLQHKLAETSKLMVSQCPEDKLLASLYLKKKNNAISNTSEVLAYNTKNPTIQHSGLLDPDKISINHPLKSQKDESSKSTRLPQPAHKLSNVFQMPVPQALTIDRIYSGGRKYVVLDFGRLVCLTDIFVPFCADIGVLYIDTWVSRMEKDSTRLVKATDIRNNNLVLTDLMPPVLCTCLKMTVVRRYGVSNGLKVPLGSFFGQTLPSPWQLMYHGHFYQQIYHKSLLHYEKIKQNPETSTVKDDDNDESLITPVYKQKCQLQLEFYKSLLEDIQCSYNLFRSKLSHLISISMTSGKAEGWGKLLSVKEHGPEEERLSQIYFETLQLQIQLNLAKKAIDRLNRNLDESSLVVPASSFTSHKQTDFNQVLKAASTDQLRFISDHLVEIIYTTILKHPSYFDQTINNPSITVSPTTINLISSLDEAFWLFSNFCVTASSPKTQLSFALLLMHHCHSQPWWGQFICKVLQQFFSTQQRLTLPQDRLFLLLVLLAQRSLLNATASYSLLTHLFSFVNHLLTTSQDTQQATNNTSLPDLQLLTWVLLMLHQSLNYLASVFICHQTVASADTSDSLKTVCWLSSSVPFSMTSRWSFINAHDSLKKSVPFSTTSESNNDMDFEPLNYESNKKISHKKKMVHKLFKLKNAKEVSKKHLWKPDVPSFVNNVFKEIFFKYKSPSSSTFKSVYSKNNHNNNLSSSNNDDSNISGFSTGKAKKSKNKEAFNKSFVCIDLENGEASIHNEVNSKDRSEYKAFDNTNNCNNNPPKPKTTTDYDTNLPLFLNEDWNVQEWNPISFIPRTDCRAFAKSLCFLVTKNIPDDLFIIVCRLLSRLMVSSKPSLDLAEVMSQESLQALLWSVCHIGNNWKQQAVVCLLQDLLEAEKLQKNNQSSNHQASASTVSSGKESALEIGKILAEVDSEDDEIEAVCDDNLMADESMDISDDQTETPAEFNESAAPDLKFQHDLSAIMEEAFEELASDQQSSFPNNQVGYFDTQDPLQWPSLGDKSIFDKSDTNKTSNNNKAPYFITYSKLLSAFNDFSFHPMIAQSSQPKTSSSAAVLPPDNSISSGCKEVTCAYDLRLEESLNLVNEMEVKKVVTCHANLFYKSLSTPLHPNSPASVATPVATGASLSLTISSSFSFLFKRLPTHFSTQSSFTLLSNMLDFFLRINMPCSKQATNNSLVSLDDQAVKHLLCSAAQSRVISNTAWLNLFRVLMLVKVPGSLTEASGRLINDDNFFKCLLNLLRGSPSLYARTPFSPSMNAGPLLVGVLKQLMAWLSNNYHHKQLLMNKLLQLVSSVISPENILLHLNAPLDLQTSILASITNLIKAQPCIVTSNNTNTSIEMDKGSDGVVCLDKGSVVAYIKAVMRLLRSYVAEEDVSLNKEQRDHRPVFARVCFKLDMKDKKVETSEKEASVHSKPSNTSMESFICSLLRLSELLVGLPLWLDAEMAHVDLCNENDAEKLPLENRGQKCCHQNKIRGKRSTMVADEVLKDENITMDLLCSLSLCQCEPHSSLSSTDLLPINQPSTIADFAVSLFDALNCKTSHVRLILKPLHQYFSSNENHYDISNISGDGVQLSEPLYWLLVQRVFDCEASLQEFIFMDGISLISRLLVKSMYLPGCSGHFISHSSHQTSLSTNILQYFSASRLVESSNDFKFANTIIVYPIGNISHSINNCKSTDEYDSQQNFAPLGSISSSVAQANPSQLLIQEFPAPRRSRSASWTYHYPVFNDWVDLVITLPCNILLTEVIIMPHFGSLENCPSMVVVETADTSNGVSSQLGSCFNTAGNSNIRIRHPGRVASVVTIRLRKPLDSIRIGLSQVLLIGSLAFSSSLSNVQNDVPTQYHSKTNSSQTLHWLLLLQHCLNKVSTKPLMQKQLIEAVRSTPHLVTCCFSLLFHKQSHLYVQRIEEFLLKLSRGSKDLSHQLFGLILNGHPDDQGLQHTQMDNATSITVNILYQTCVGGIDNLNDEKLNSINDEVKEKVCMLVSWLSQMAESVKDSTTHGLTHVTRGPSASIVSCVASILWRLQDHGKFKNILVSSIHHHVIRAVFDWFNAVSRDVALSRSLGQLLSSFVFIHPSSFPQMLHWMSLLQADVDINEETYQRMHQYTLTLDNLSEDSLTLLSRISKTPVALDFMQQCGLLSASCGLLQRFFEQEISNDSQKVTMAGAGSLSDLVLPLLNFLRQLCIFPYIKTLLGTEKYCAFWYPMLQCISIQRSLSAEKGLIYENFLNMESLVVKFLGTVSLNHPANQLSVSHLLVQAINSSSINSTFQQPLTSVLKELLLQVMLEDERTAICLHSKHPAIRSPHPSAFLPPPALFHPECGSGIHNIILSATLPSTIADVVAAFSAFPVADSSNETKDKRILVTSSLLPEVELTGSMKVAELLWLLGDKHKRNVCVHLSVDLVFAPPKTLSETIIDIYKMFTIPTPPSEESSSIKPLPSILEVFSSIGGLALLAEKLPFFLPKPIHSSNNVSNPVSSSKASSNLASSPPPHHKWTHLNLKKKMVETEYFTTYPDPLPSFSSKAPTFGSSQQPFSSQQAYANNATSSNSNNPRQNLFQQLHKLLVIPPHSMVCFSLALRMPSFSEELLREGKKARCMLKVMLGAVDQEALFDIAGLKPSQQAISSPSPLSHFPFNVLSRLLSREPLDSSKGQKLRLKCMELGLVHLILACISVFGHHEPRRIISGLYQDVLKVAHQSQTHMFGGARGCGTATEATSTPTQETTAQTGSAPNYWAKGTGFGTGSTTSNWDAENLLLRQKLEEEHVANLLKVLASLIEVKDQSTEGTEEDTQLPEGLADLLSDSCLINALSSYLRNDSVLDMACHIPIYRAFLHVLRAISQHPALTSMLLPSSTSDPLSPYSISALLEKMKKCVDTYANRLKLNLEKQKGPSTSTKGAASHKGASVFNTHDCDETEGLAQLVPIIQETSLMVNEAIQKHLCVNGTSKDTKKKAPVPSSTFMTSSVIGKMSESFEEKYISTMRRLQYDTYSMVLEEGGVIKFTVPHHYEAKVRATGEVSSALRARRLAQETVTLSTSLPLSSGSSVFVRCDEERLDVMKVLITGPTDTPYANGCFEFDVFFPADYPNSPPLINMQTTGGSSIRFNPNLYNDGKVCLSIINTWHGKPEEKWSQQTSSLLQVLVSIQSLILVHEPYFNEPGYERSKGTAAGTASSKEYDANIRQATVRWGMLEMIRNPPAVFKQIIKWHFWLKKEEILSQIMDWLMEMESLCGEKRVGKNISTSLASLKKHYNQLKVEFDKMEAPEEIDSWNFQLTSSEDDEEHTHL